MKRFLFFCSLLLVVSLACEIPGTVPPTPIPTFDDNLISTMVVQTAEALALSATSTNTTIPLETLTSTPTLTAAPTEPPTIALVSLPDVVTLMPPPGIIVAIPTYTLVPATDTSTPFIATSIPATSIPSTATQIPFTFTPTFTATFTSTPTVMPTGTPVIITCAKTNQSFEADVMSLINIERAKAGVPILNYQPQLGAAAELYSADMACHDYLAHTGRDGSDFVQRAERQGYRFNYGGENLGGGYSTPEEVVKGWMNSPAHKANLLGANYTEMGVGYAYQPNSYYVAYWAAIFGSPKK